VGSLYVRYPAAKTFAYASKLVKQVLIAQGIRSQNMRTVPAVDEGYVKSFSDTVFVTNVARPAKFEVLFNARLENRACVEIFSIF
jgi:hypothetical protein